MTSDDNLFLTAEEVSQYLRIPVSTVYKLVQDSVLPAFRVGKYWGFGKDNTKWLMQRLFGSNEIFLRPINLTKTR
jgi:excisionase family DNA binding protein